MQGEQTGSWGGAYTYRLYTWLIRSYIYDVSGIVYIATKRKRNIYICTLWSAHTSQPQKPDAAVGYAYGMSVSDARPCARREDEGGDGRGVSLGLPSQQAPLRSHKQRRRANCKLRCLDVSPQRQKKEQQHLNITCRLQQQYSYDTHCVLSSVLFAFLPR